MDRRLGERVRWVVVVVGIVLFCAGLALAEYSVFTLADYHIVGLAMSGIGSWLAAYGFLAGHSDVVQETNSQPGWLLTAPEPGEHLDQDPRRWYERMPESGLRIVMEYGRPLLFVVTKSIKVQCHVRASQTQRNE